MATRDPSVYLVSLPFSLPRVLSSFLTSLSLFLSVSLSWLFLSVTYTRARTFSSSFFSIISLSLALSLVLSFRFSSNMYTYHTILLHSLFPIHEHLLPFLLSFLLSKLGPLYFIPFSPFLFFFFRFLFFFFSSLILAHVTSNPLFSSLSPFSRTFSTLYLPPFSGFSFSFAHPTFNHFFFFLFFFSFLLSFEHCYAIFFCFLIPPYIQTILYFHSLSPVFVSFPDHFLSKISLFSTRTSHYSISLFYNYYILLIIITFYLLENILLYFLYFIYFLTSLFIIYICII